MSLTADDQQGKTDHGLEEEEGVEEKKSSDRPPVSPWTNQSLFWRRAPVAGSIAYRQVPFS
jgi:hypothetical protein